MALTISTASDLLKQIIGKGTTSSYLALSSTKPDPSGKGAQGYNITEPLASTSYNRVSIASYFTEDPYDELVDDTYTVSIKNGTEIHFPEALQDWGNYKYFAIFTLATGGTPKYVGELLKFTQDTEVTAENYAEKVAAGLYYFDASQSDYIKITNEPYDETGETKYYYKDDSGIDILEGTVPLVRKGYLKISVQ